MASHRKNVVLRGEKQARRLAGIRAAHARMAALLGVAHILPKLPAHAREWFLASPVLEPTVIADSASAGRPNASRIRAKLQERLRQATITLQDGTEIPATHPFVYGRAISMGLKAILDNFKEPDLLQLAGTGHALVCERLRPLNDDALTSITAALRAAAADHSRIDTELVSFTMEHQFTPTGRTRLVVIFTLTDPQSKDILLDGQPRRTFRCAGHHGPHMPLEWVPWRAALVGLNESDPPLPVYVQTHAIRRLEERLGELGLPAVHFWMWASLRFPFITAAEGDRFTVEYRILEWRLGYLYARRTAEGIVVTTFVFLTMEGTPEARLLYDKLRLRRSDIAYQDLDKLATFTRTDLLDDPELRVILEQCGCGHLTGIKALLGQECRAYAGEFRKYLRLDEHRQRQNFSERLGLSLPDPSP